LRSLNYGTLERQLLESVERVAVKENADRCPGRQEVGDAINCLVQFFPPRQHGIGPGVNRFVLAWDFASCRATSFSMLTVLLSWE
jgi:hypothetical protein